LGRQWNKPFSTGLGGFAVSKNPELAAFMGVIKAVLCVNGTAALHISLKMSGLERDDQVCSES
jgi:dTDP-4-amino-4,6-dideoxygalactose transaminase